MKQNINLILGSMSVTASISGIIAMIKDQDHWLYVVAFLATAANVAFAVKYLKQYLQTKTNKP
jgi:hypothetical protein